MPKLKTHEEFESELKYIRPDINVIGIYKNSNTKIKFRHNCGYIWETTPTTILKGKSCPSCMKTLGKTQDEFKNELYLLNNNIKVIGKYINNETKIKCVCLVCNNEFNSLPTNLLRNHGCPFCSGRSVSVDNCIINTHPYIEKYLLDKNDGYKYSKGSHKHINFVCPDCGNIRNLEIKMVISQGFSCTKCGDGISYPNKFGRELLRQLPVTNIVHEFSEKWSNGKLYDNYFEYNNKKYILEMDGEFHYKYNHLNKQTENKSKEIDNIKDNLAKEHGINVIRIDCRKPYFDYIKNNIIKSELNDIFDLSIIDWSLCEKYAIKNIIKEVCLYYQNNKKNLTYKKLSNIFSLSEPTIIRYLKIGKEIGWVNDYCDVEGCLLRQYQTDSSKSIPINVFDKETNFLLYNFKSINLCANQLSIYDGERYNPDLISKNIKNNNGIYKKYLFKYA